MIAKRLIGIILAGIILVAGAGYFAMQQGNGVHRETLIIQTAAGTSHKFKVEIARTTEEQNLGLMFREQMAQNHGMLFVKSPPVIESFWMKNTLIPLDMIFIKEDGTISKIHENAVPGSLDPISSEIPVAGIVEINGGLAKKLGIAVGDKVLHDVFNTGTFATRWF
jgi:uncharacterized membrane protein (UPF0127 family)